MKYLKLFEDIDNIDFDAEDWDEEEYEPAIIVRNNINKDLLKVKKYLSKIISKDRDDNKVMKNGNNCYFYNNGDLEPYVSIQVCKPGSSTVRKSKYPDYYSIDITSLDGRWLRVIKDVILKRPSSSDRFTILFYKKEDWLGFINDCGLRIEEKNRPVTAVAAASRLSLMTKRGTRWERF